MENLRFNTLTKPFIIAEMSGNHNQSLERALRIVDAAAEAGVDAIKLQTYTADTMTLDLNEGDFFISNPQSPWYGSSLYALYQKAHTPWAWQEKIFARAREHGLICFSTPFDATAVDFLEELGAPCYKIASFENTDLPLIRKVAQTGKPLIVSTGMATVADLDELVRTARENGCRDITLLKCTSSYPATPAGSNILTIPHMKALFGCNVGLSSTLPSRVGTEEWTAHSRWNRRRWHNSCVNAVQRGRLSVRSATRYSRRRRSLSSFAAVSTLSRI